jgi:hypothetical protein
MFWRWHTATSYPTPAVKRVAFAELRRHLPPDTPTVSEAQRAAERTARISHHQSRRRW